MKRMLLLVLACSVVMQACIEIIPSERRPAEPVVFQLPGKVTLTSDGAVYMMKSDFIPPSFKIKSDNMVCYIDPLLIVEPEPADYIFITHDHLDHFSPDDIARISNQHTVIVGPQSVVKKLKNHNTRKVEPGDELDLNGLLVECTAAYSQGFPSHPKRIKYVGYILNINGTRIFHPGDTDLVPEIESIRNIDVALMPLDGGAFAMSTEDAAKLTNSMQPGMVIPMHYGLGKQVVATYKSLLELDTVIKEIQPE